MFRALYLAMLAGCAWLSAGCDPEGFPVTAQHVQRGLRPTEPGASSPSYPVGTSLESFALPNGSFRVHFTRGGTHGVPESGTEPPTSVVAVAEVYEAALQHYIDNLGYRRPVSDRGEGGDDLIDVYMIDFGGRGDGAFVIDACEGPGGPCAGHIRHENDFRGYSYPSTRVANRILSSHELFHAVQAAYTVGQTVVLTEGSAVWATENFDGELADFEGFIDGYLTDTGRSLTFDGGVFDGFGYGTGVFFQFLAEWDHPDVIRALWQARADSLETKWLATLDEVLRERGRSFEEAFSAFSEWNLRIATGRRPTYGNASQYPPVSARDIGASGSERLRVLPASMAVFRAKPVEGDFVFAFDFDDGDVWVETVSYRLSYQTIPGGEWSEFEVGTAGRTSDSVALPAGATMRMALVNTSTGGASARPTMCWGSPSEVSDCLVALLPETPPPVDDPEMPPPEDDPDVPPVMELPPSGCSMASAPSGLSWPGLILILAVLRAGRRNTRRERSWPRRGRVCAPTWR